MPELLTDDPADLEGVFASEGYGETDLIKMSEGRPKPGYNDLRLVPREMPRQEALWASLSGDERLQLEGAVKTAADARRASQEHFKKTRYYDKALQDTAVAADRAFWALRDGFVERTGNKAGKENLMAAVRRSTLDVRPPGPNRDTPDPLGAPLPIWTAHNWDILRDDPYAAEYCAAAGMVPTFCYSLCESQMDRVIDHMGKAHKWYRTPTTVTRGTPMKTVRRILSRRNDGSAVFVVDEGGTVLGAMSDHELREHDRENAEVSGYHDRPVAEMMTPVSRMPMETESDALNPEGAWNRITQGRGGTVPYLAVQCRDNVLRVISKTDAGVGMMVDPFIDPVHGGLGYVFSLGQNEKWHPIDRIKKYASRVRAWCADTAHMDREDAMHLLRQIAEAAQPENVMAAGTVISPAATRRLVGYGYKIIKSGIGGGAQCKTTTTATGIGLPSAYAHYLNGVAAAEVGGVVLADGGINSYATQCKAMTFPGVAYTMQGTWMGPLRETAAPYVDGPKGRHKLVAGEASMGRVESRLRELPTLTTMEEVMLYLGPHSEGAEASEVYPEYKRDTFGQRAYALRAAMQSVLSYLDAGDWHAAKAHAQYALVA